MIVLYGMETLTIQLVITQIHLQNVSGCDSIAYLDLTIYYSVYTYDTIVACDSANWNNTTYTNSGIYIDTLLTVNGADSIKTLDLTINYSAFSSEQIIACDSAIWNGNTYNTSGIYIDTLQTIFGCDSVASLYLTINNSNFTSRYRRSM